MIALDWHGWRSALTREGRLPDVKHAPAGIEMELRAGVTHVGVPMHHYGKEVHVKALTAAGLQIVRTMEPPWNVGRPGIAGDPPDLGRVLLDWQSVDNPGPLFSAYAEALKAPAVGIGWNLEHDPESYPITSADKEWAKGIVDRSSQFSLLLRLYQAVAQRKLGHPVFTVAYSGYDCVLHNGKTLSEAYSVDWDLLSKPVTYRGQTFPPLDYADCGYSGLALPKLAVVRPLGLHLLHSIGLPLYGGKEDLPNGKRWKDYETVIANRVKVAKEVPGDGIGLVACSPLSGPWNNEEDRLRVLLSKYRSESTCTP